MAIQFALTLIMLVGACLLVRNFGKFLETSLGCRPDDVLTLNVPLPQQAYSQVMQAQTIVEIVGDVRQGPPNTP